MKRYLRIAIESGATTCEREKGKYRAHVGTKHFGLGFVCMLFVDDKKNERNLSDNGSGFLARLPECMRADVES